MVGYEPDSGVKLKETDYMVAGAVSGFVTRTLFQPLDVLKIRFQLQIEPIRISSHASKYTSMHHALRCILKEEGVHALWKGIVPAQFLSTTYGALQFLSFELLTKEAWRSLPQSVLENAKPLVNFACGALAGCVATTVSLPFDVLRTRLVAQGEPKVYKSMLDASTQMLRREGPRSFYKGLLPTLIQITPNAGSQFAFYKVFQEMWVITFKKDAKDSGKFQSSCCGAAAGIAAKTFVYPLDLIKKRIQVQGFDQARKTFGAIRHYSGLVHCFVCILREEGVFGLYKGLCPGVLKAACTTGSHFLYYEETLKIMTYVHR